MNNFYQILQFIFVFCVFLSPFLLVYKISRNPDKIRSTNFIFVLIIGSFICFAGIFYFGLNSLFNVFAKNIFGVYRPDPDVIGSASFLIAFFSSGFIIFYITGFFTLKDINNKLTFENKENLKISYFLCELHFSEKNNSISSVEELNDFVSMFEGSDELTVDEEEIIKAAKLALVEWKQGEEWDYDPCLTLCFGDDFDWDNFGESS